MRFIRFEEGSGYCGKSLKQVPVSRARIRHLPYILFTFVTFGVGAFFWIREARKEHPWKCLDCGCEVYRIMN